LELSLRKKMHKIAIAGLGNIGGAIYEILSSDGSFNVSGFGRTEDPNAYLHDVDALIIAVKPQSFEKFAKTVTIDLSNVIVISTMAGKSIENIQRTLKCKKVVRVMPNLPLQVGHNFCAWIVSNKVSNIEKGVVRKILNRLGKEMEVKKEEKIDRITALSGSGPAYYCRMAEAVERSAKKMGFGEKESKIIARETLIGTAKLMDEKNFEATELKAIVTSKGGTTAAALSSFNKQGFDKVVYQSILAAYKRAKELNDDNE